MAGSRRASRKAPTLRPDVLLLALGVTVSVVAWGYLVYLAIDFGTSARGGDSAAWWFLALSSLGAVACLFLGLLLIARILRALGITRDPDGVRPPASPASVPAPRPVRVPGGRRAAR